MRITWFYHSVNFLKQGRFHLYFRKISSITNIFLVHWLFSSSGISLTCVCLHYLSPISIHLLHNHFCIFFFLTISFLWFHKSPVLLPLVIYWGIFILIVTTASMVAFILFLFLSSVSSWILSVYFLSFSLVIYSLNLCISSLGCLYCLQFHWIYRPVLINRTFYNDGNVLYLYLW